MASTSEPTLAGLDSRKLDRLSPLTLHALVTILTAIRGQEHMVRRWIRLRDDSDGVDKVLESVYP